MGSQPSPDFHRGCRINPDSVRLPVLHSDYAQIWHCQANTTEHTMDAMLSIANRIPPDSTARPPTPYYHGRDVEAGMKGLPLRCLEDMHSISRFGQFVK